MLSPAPQAQIRASETRSEYVEDDNKKEFPADFGSYSYFGFSFAFCESTV
jgi:hypothetical protein